MSNRDDFYAMISGKGRQEKIPLAQFGFWNQVTMNRLAPPECCDGNMLDVPADFPPQDTFSPEPRTEESRRRAVRMARYLDTAFIGVGKGGVLKFGHGGPGEIQPRVIERTEEYKILLYEGGHKRRINYDPHSIHYFDFPVVEEEDLDALVLPDMSDPVRFQDIEEDCAFFKREGFVPTGTIQGFFSGIHNSFMDFEDTVVNLLLEPEFMKRVTERLARMSLKAVEMYMERGVEIIDVCDDLGTAQGLIISPQLVREFFIPWYEELARVVHDRGGLVHLHSHGNIRDLMPDFASIGVDIINPFDWNETPDMVGLMHEFGDRIIFCGGSIGNLYQCSVDEVERIVKRACGLRGHAGRGYIFMGAPATDNGLREAPENRLRFLFSAGTPEDSNLCAV